jgi:type I restriction enzyme, S subunit
MQFGLPSMMPQWPTLELREVAEVRISNVDKKSYASEHPVKLCNYMDVYANDYLTSTLDFMLATAGPSEIERFSLRVGDVVITKDSENPDDIGVPAVVVEAIDNLVCGYHLALIRPKGRIHPVYLAKQLASSRTTKYFAAHATGSTRYGLPIGTIEKLDILVPPPGEQSKIAQVLWAVDRVIEQTEALIAKQQRIKTGLMQDLLTRGIAADGNLRSEQTHKFMDSALGRIPVEWAVTSIGAQFALRKERGRRGLPVMSIVMGDGLVQRSKVDRRVESALPDEGHALVREGDIAYNMMRMWQGVLGRASFDCLVSPAYVVIQPRASIDSRFAEWLFRDLRMVRLFRRASRGVVDDRLRLYPNDIFPIQFAMPESLDEQSAISERLEAQKALIEAQLLTLEKLRHLRAGLMQDLLTGKQRVTTLLEQPEAVTV